LKNHKFVVITLAAMLAVTCYSTTAEEVLHHKHLKLTLKHVLSGL